jgi:hypothetical protein
MITVPVSRCNDNNSCQFIMIPSIASDQDSSNDEKTNGTIRRMAIGLLRGCDARMNDTDKRRN